ncbi:hypothetical protein E5082_28425 [Streptomyces griseoluteus]|uniref:Uncharacterized protein n=1 Tax=Streptomyces griseoluteus TaxID=29306 RepID=A0A4Z1D3B9_STRGP|nr:hypothetical protein [Streptomyces griseoluteus]TGN76131.1 hypothetical protein E5082_28425 [Streptomyces griseoluteus]GHE93283.1 hypothetical protein GCM10017776_07230 [Streptomyces griseoluteus]
MDLDKPPAPQPPEGCLVVALRLPVRIVVLVLVVPVRLAWDALVAARRFLHATVLRPLGRALRWAGRALFVWPFVALWRWVLVPVGTALRWLGHVLVVAPLCRLHAHLLTPLGHALRWAARGVVTCLLAPVGRGLAWLARGVVTHLLAPVGRGLAWLARGAGALLAAVGLGVFTGAAWLVRYLLVVPARWLYVHVLGPVGRALLWVAEALVTGAGAVLYWTARILFVLPALAVWRWVLAPVGRVLAVVAREVVDALGHAWRVAGHLSRVVGRALGTLFRWIFVEPARWVYRTVLTPVGHVVRDVVLRPAARAAREVGRVTRLTLAAARETLRETRRDLRRALFGEPRQQPAVDRREPPARDPRTLGSSTTVLTKD